MSNYSEFKHPQCWAINQYNEVAIVSLISSHKLIKFATKSFCLKPMTTSDTIQDIHKTYTADSQVTTITILNCNNLDWQLKHTLTTTIISTYTMLLGNTQPNT